MNTDLLLKAGVVIIAVIQILKMVFAFVEKQTLKKNGDPGTVFHRQNQLNHKCINDPRTSQAHQNNAMALEKTKEIATGINDLKIAQGKTTDSVKSVDSKMETANKHLEKIANGG